jgi:hypothetical protein
MGGQGGDGGTAGPGGLGGMGGDALGGDLYAVSAAMVGSLNGTAMVNGSVRAGTAGLGGDPGAVGIGGPGGSGGAGAIGGSGSPVGPAGVDGIAGGSGLDGQSSTMGQGVATGLALYPEANLLATATRVTASHASALAGQSLTFTVTVTDIVGAPTGSVELFDGSIDLGTTSEVTAGHTSATFTFTTSQLPPGTQRIQAVFTGTGYFADSSGSLAEKIDAATTTVVVSNHNPASKGQAVTFMATITDTSSAIAPTGRVAFFDGSIYLGTGTVLAGSGNSATSTFTTTRLPAGNDVIVAVYQATGEFLGSRGAVVQRVASSHFSKLAAGEVEPADPTTVIDHIFGEAGGESLAERMR